MAFQAKELMKFWKPTSGVLGKQKADLIRGHLGDEFAVGWAGSGHVVEDLLAHIIGNGCIDLRDLISPLAILHQLCGTAAQVLMRVEMPAVGVRFGHSCAEVKTDMKAIEETVDIIPHLELFLADVIQEHLPGHGLFHWLGHKRRWSWSGHVYNSIKRSLGGGRRRESPASTSIYDKIRKNVERAGKRESVCMC